MVLTRTRAAVLLLAGAVALALAFFWLGRATVAPHGYAQGRTDGYFDGLRVGEAQGREEGRALQEGQALAPADRRPVHDAFVNGYASGANDAFAGYDGGWSYGVPYVVVIEPGSGDIVYRIASREVLKPGIDYRLCSGGHAICRQP